jgi:CheY-like chemotaxis protein
MSEPPGEKRTILVVEDDHSMQEAFTLALEYSGYDVIGAANGAEALDKLRAGARPCAILLDLMMPVMDGWRFREEQLKDAALAGIPVIVVSAAGPDSGMESLRAAAFLGKPVDLKRLLSTVAAVCR